MKEDVMDVMDRRSMLQFSGGGAALVLAGAATGARMNRGQGGGQRARTKQVARRLLAAIATTDSSVIFALFVPGAPVDFPFLNLTVTDQATFDATVGPVLANIQGFTISEPTFTDLLDERAAIIRYTGHGIVGLTG